MTTLSGVQILEAIGNVDDGLVAESLDFFYPAATGGVPVFVPAPKRRNRVFRTALALGLAAAMLCGGVTVLPLLGGPDLWGGFYGVIAPLLRPDETEEPYESEYECEADSEEATREPEDEEETRKDSDFFDPDEYFTGGVVQDPPTVPTPNIPTAPDPSPNLPGFNWDYDLPNTPPGPTYNPGPGPVRNPNLGG